MRTVKPDKIDAEIAQAREEAAGERAGGRRRSYDAVVTAVHDDDKELEVDLGDWPAALVLGGDDDARFNPPDDGDGKKPSERFKVGDVRRGDAIAAGEPQRTKTTTMPTGDEDEAATPIARSTRSTASCSRPAPRARS